MRAKTGRGGHERHDFREERPILDVGVVFVQQGGRQPQHLGGDNAESGLFKSGDHPDPRGFLHAVRLCRDERAFHLWPVVVTHRDLRVKPRSEGDTVRLAKLFAGSRVWRGHPRDRSFSRRVTRETPEPSGGARLIASGEGHGLDQEFPFHDFHDPTVGRKGFVPARVGQFLRHQFGRRSAVGHRWLPEFR